MVGWEWREWLLKSHTGCCLQPTVSSLPWPLRFPSKEQSACGRLCVPEVVLCDSYVR